MVDNTKLPEMGSILYLQHLAEFEVAEGGNYLQGTITHVSDPCNFYLNPQNRKRKQFMELTSQLQKECKLAKPCDIANIQPGCFYAAYRNTEWLRVLLEKIVGPGKGWVFYIDTGYRETLSLVKLRPLSERYQTIPAQAFLCQLVSIIPPSQKDAALSEICTSIKKMLKNSFVTVFVEDEFEGWVGQLQKNETKLFVTAYVGDEEMSINSKVTQAGYGISLKRHEESWHQKVRESFLTTMEKQEKPVITYAKVAASKNAVVSNGPKQLLVSVCHVVDPGKFFVHCKHSEIEAKQLRYLRYLLDKSAELSPATEILVGQLYAVFDGQIQHWYRGQCLRDIVEEEPSEVVCEFFMIDEGHHQNVPISSVRMLTPELLQIRPMALECSLSGGPPPGDGRWLPPAIALFKQLTQRSQFKMTVFSNDGGTLKVDLAQMPSFPGEEVIASLRDAVLFMPKNLSPAKSVPVARTPVVHSPSASSGRKFYSKFAQIITGTRLHGQVVQVSNPCSFYVHFDESGPEEFAEMHRELQEELNLPGVKGSLAVRTVQLGSPYVICRNQVWYRALVEEILGNGNIVVFLVDYGQRLSVTVPELRQIPDRFLDVPAQLTYCKLDLVRPDPTTGIWTNESKCFFKQLVSDARVTAFVQGKVIGRVGRALIKELALFVILYVGDDKVSVNTKLTSAGHGVSRANQGCHESPTHHRPDTSTRPEAMPAMPSAVPALFSVERAAQLQQSPCSASASLPSHPSPPASSNSTTSPPKEEHSLCTFDSENISEVVPVSGYWPKVNANHIDACTTDVLAAEVTDLESLHFFDIDESIQIYGTMPSDADYVMAVRFLACESPEAIYFRPLPYEAKYRELHFQLQSAYSASVFHQSYNFNPGMWCAAYVYGRWIRAVVNDFDEELQCSVTSVDSGQSYQVMIDQIFPLVEPFSSIRRLALKCSLAGIQPTNGVWTAEARSKITRALLRANQVFVCCPSRPKAIPSTMSVSIVYRQSTENGRALVNLNEYLVKENVASVASNSKRSNLSVHHRR